MAISLRLKIGLLAVTCVSVYGLDAYVLLRGKAPRVVELPRRDPPSPAPVRTEIEILPVPTLAFRYAGNPTVEELPGPSPQRIEISGTNGIVPLSPPERTWLIPVAAPASRRDPGIVAAEIDREIDALLRNANLAPSPRSEDAEFLRRVTLDITGSIPTTSRTKRFLQDASPGKRAALIDELLASPAYGARFADYWHRLILKRDEENNRSIFGQDIFIRWLSERINKNDPWDATVRGMIAAKGDQTKEGGLLFVLANTSAGQPVPSKMAATASALFHGNQIQCAECHAHPSVPAWKPADFWGLTAFFGKTNVHYSPEPFATKGMVYITDSSTPPPTPLVLPPNNSYHPPRTGPTGEIKIPDPREADKTIGRAKAKFPDADRPYAGPAISRETASVWFTDASNPFFPRAAVNRYWSCFLGRGLVDPVDDLRPDNRASHPEALESLAGELIASGFDMKHLIRCICLTEAYQRSSRASASPLESAALFGHMPVKPLTPRTLYASLAVATTGAIRGPSQGFPFFDTREYDESPLDFGVTAANLLKLMNRQLPEACDRAAEKFLALKPTEALEEIYLVALTRKPTDAESIRMTEFMRDRGNTRQKYSAALWVLLNSAEFMVNH